MIEIDIPGHRNLRLKHLVLDYNGTLARDGRLLSGVKNNLEALADKLNIHVLTADTFGRAEQGLRGIPCRLSILPSGSQDVGKLKYIQDLGCQSAVCVGNGRNDRLMLREAALGIVVVLEEGASAEAVSAADVVCSDIVSALQLLSNPLRLVATLRS